MFIHPCLFRLICIICKGVGCQGDNGNPGPSGPLVRAHPADGHVAPYPSRTGIWISMGISPKVPDDFPQIIHCPAICGACYLQSAQGQKFFYDFPVQLIIFCQEDTGAGPECPWRLNRGFPVLAVGFVLVHDQLQIHGFTTNRVPLFRWLSTWMVPFIICTRLRVMGRPSPVPLGLTDPLILRPLKGSEHLFLKCLSHADPSSSTMNSKRPTPLRLDSFFFQ